MLTNTIYKFIFSTKKLEATLFTSSLNSIYLGSLSNSGHGEKQEMKSRQHFAA